MTALVTVRPLTAQDYDAWATLWHGYLTYYETTLDAQIYRSTFERLCDAAEPTMQGRLAIVDGVPVGLVHYILHRHCWRTEDVTYLQDLFTAPAARGHGVARALIETVYVEADALGAPAVYWMTQDFNATARRLYDRIGTCTPFIKYQRPQ